MIIDYKTGNANPKDWFGERPDEPQLPLYGISNTQEVAGLIFAQLRTGELRFKGFSQGQNIIPDVPDFSAAKSTHTMSYASTWPQQFNDWRQVLQNLAEEFRSGYAAVEPKKPGDTCKYCELTALCRIHEHDRLGLGLAPDAQDENDS